MKLEKLLSAIAVCGLLAIGQAQAADLLYPNPTPVQAASYNSGFYAGIKGGYNQSDDLTACSGGFCGTGELDGGFNFGGVVGYSLGKFGIFTPRVEAELGYLESSLDNVQFSFGGVPFGAAQGGTGDLNAVYGFANLLLDIPLGWGFTPFIGGGAGIASVNADNIGTTGFGVIVDDSNTSFAWNLTAGVAYELSRNVTVEAAYRFVRFDSVEFAGSGATFNDDVDNHQFNLGFRVKL